MTQPVDPELRVAANAVLGLAGNSPTERVRKSFFQRLDDYDFTPPGEAVDAARVLGVIPLGDEPTPDLERYRRRRLESEIDRFAADYWGLEPEDRQSRWLELRANADDAPRAADRLSRLHAGLDLVPPKLDGKVGELIRIICDLYPLGLAERAALRRGWIQRQSASLTELRKAVEVVKLDYPRWAALVPDLFVALLALDSRHLKAGYGFRSGMRALGVAYPDWWKVVILIVAVVGMIGGLIIYVEATRPPRSATNAPIEPYTPKKVDFSKRFGSPQPRSSIATTTSRSSRP